MKKIGSVLLGAVCINLMLMVPAFAGSELPPPGGEVITPPGATDATAFTGANVTMWMVLAVALLAMGLAIFLAGRRRRAAAE